MKLHFCYSLCVVNIGEKNESFYVISMKFAALIYSYD